MTTLAERDFVTSVRYSNNDEYLAVADNAKNVKCYKLDRSNKASHVEITRDLWQHHAGKITSLSWSPDSSHLATSSVDTHCFIYSPSNTSDFIQIKSNRFAVFFNYNFYIHYLNINSFYIRCTSIKPVDGLRMAKQQSLGHIESRLLHTKMEI